MKSMSFTKYTVGDGFVSTVEVRESTSQVLVDPASIVLRLKDPAGTETAITPVKLDVGIYQAKGVLNMKGNWYRQWKATTPDGVDEDVLIVEPSNFT
jgi:hypothetical protein